MRISSRVWLAIAVSIACGACPPGGQKPPAGGGGGGGGGGGDVRSPAVAPDHPLYARVEAPDRDNDCTADTGCFQGGCSSEVCSAEEGIITTCDAIEQPYPAGAQCGCVQNQCVWYTTPGGTSGGDGAAQGAPCDDGRCQGELTCVKYYGIAGPSGPQFTSCEVPCSLPGSVCPDGQACITIADGPGRVCRPASGS